MRDARVLLWNTSCLEPRIEAISKEIWQLCRHFPRMRAFGVSRHYRLRMAEGGRIFGAHVALDPLLRLAIPPLEATAQISHVYGEMSPWIYHKTLRRKPLILTIASEHGEPIPEFTHRCRAIVTQTRSLRKRLRDSGLEDVRWIPPGVDLDRFRPSPPPEGPTRVLFATAPRTREEMAPRGVELLIDAAAAAPDVHFRLLYRPWSRGYTSYEPTRHRLAERGGSNVLLTNEAAADMPAAHADHHFTVIPYTEARGGKECPNSLVEGLACGRPALISSAAPFAEYVREQECGVVFEPEPEALAAAVEEGRRRWDELAANARRAAERDFDSKRTLASYEALYAECLAPRA